MSVAAPSRTAYVGPMRVDPTLWRPWPMLLAAAAGSLLAGAIALWLWQGAAVFEQMVMAAVRLCF